MRLLSFAKKCLQTPVRGSKRWSLANLMKKQVNQDLPTIEGHTTGPPEQSKPTKKHNQMEQLALRVSSKLEEGNCRGAVRLACIKDAIIYSETLRALKAKHPPSPSDSNIFALDHTSPLAFTTDTEVIKRAISSFPKRLSGSCYGLLPQHPKDLIKPSGGNGGAALLSALVGLTTLILEGRIPTFTCPLSLEQI